MESDSFWGMVRSESPTDRHHLDAIADASALILLIARPAMPVQMQLSRIIISEINEQQVIYLKEVHGDRQFPILIGIFEATSIDRRVKSYRALRVP